MTPNLVYAQMQRGPDGQMGSHTGILFVFEPFDDFRLLTLLSFSDLKAMAKVTTGILVLRKGNSTLWTTELDNQMIAWAGEYTNWLETAEIAIAERDATKYLSLIRSPPTSAYFVLFSHQQSRHFLLQPARRPEDLG
jgi:hypothetical protein